MDINTNLIRLYLKNETEFDHNKYILSDCISCLVTETTDGILDLDLEYPLKDRKNISGLLVRGNIIKCPISTTDSRGEQLFKIRTRTPSITNNSIKIYAQAIARRDLDSFNMVVDLKTTPGITRKQAMQEILNHCAKSHNFTIGNLDTSTVTNINMGYEDETGNLINYLTINGYSPRKAFLDESENSIYKAWGGEIIWNNFEINMVDERGLDHSFIIESGKNLEELEQTIDDTDLDNFVTAIMPVSSDGVYLPNHEIIYSSNHNILEGSFMKLVCDDVSLTENATDQQAAFNVLYAQLRARVQKKFADGIDKLKINNTVKFTQLSNTEEYKQFKVLEKCEIGNNVTIKYYDPYDPQKKIYIEATGRVLKIKFNVLTNRIEEVEIGDRKKQNILTTINATVNSATTLNDRANTNKTNIKKKTKEAKEDAITKSNAYTDAYKVIMDARAHEIELSVTNKVDNTTYQSKIDMIDTAIESSVTKNDFGTYIKQHFDDIVATINDGTEHNVILNADGLTVQNGAFTLEDSSGTIVLRANLNGGIGLSDLDMMNGEAVNKGSMFYNTLHSMEEVSLQNLKVENLVIPVDTYVNGFGGTLKEYIINVVTNM